MARLYNVTFSVPTHGNVCLNHFQERRKLAHARLASSHEDCYDSAHIDTALTSETFGLQWFLNPNTALEEYNSNMCFQEKYFCCTGWCTDFTGKKREDFLWSSCLREVLCKTWENLKWFKTDRKTISGRLNIEDIKDSDFIQQSLHSVCISQYRVNKNSNKRCVETLHWQSQNVQAGSSVVAALLWGGGQGVTHRDWVACVCLGDFTLFTKALQECPTIRPIGSCSTDPLARHWLIWGPAAWKHCLCNSLALCSCLQLWPAVCLTIAQTRWLTLDLRPSPYRSL